MRKKWSKVLSKLPYSTVDVRDIFVIPDHELVLAAERLEQHGIEVPLSGPGLVRADDGRAMPALQRPEEGGLATAGRECHHRHHVLDRNLRRLRPERGGGGGGQLVSNAMSVFLTVITGALATPNHGETRFGSAPGKHEHAVGHIARRGWGDAEPLEKLSK